MEDGYEFAKDERHRKGTDINPKKRLNVSEVIKRQAQMEKRNEQRNRLFEQSTSSSNGSNTEDFEEIEFSKPSNKKKNNEISTKMSKQEKQKLYE